MMPWGLLALVLILTYVLQTAVVPAWALPALDLLLTLALVCGLVVSPPDARLAGWITGLAQDIGSSGPLGLHALALGLAVMGLGRLREMVNRELWWVRALIAFVVAWPAQLLVLLHARFMQDAALSWPALLGQSLLTAVVAALLAALLVGVPGLWRRRQRHYTFSRR